MSQLTDLTRSAINLLDGVLQDWDSSVTDIKDDFAAWFGYSHGINIRDLASAITELRIERKARALRVLIRPCLESLFNLSASFQRTEYAKNKVHAELRNQKDRIEKWRGLKLPDQAEYLDHAESEMDRMIKMLVDNVGTATDKNDWSTISTAQLSAADAYYRTAYFMYSLHTHANFVTLMQSEEEMEATLDSTLMIITSLVILTVCLILNQRQLPRSNEQRQLAVRLSLELQTLSGV